MPRAMATGTHLPIGPGMHWDLLHSSPAQEMLQDNNLIEIEATLAYINISLQICNDHTKTYSH